MIYDALKSMALELLKTPSEPSDPMGNVRSLKVFRASINYYYYRLAFWLLKELGHAAVVVFVFVMVVVFLEKPGLSAGAFHAPPSPRTALLSLELLLAALGGLYLLAHAFATYVILRLDYEMRWYKVSDRSLRIREGVLKVREMTMTFANIQNISVSQGPVQSLFGIADLKVESAGGVFMPKENTPGASFNLHVAFFKGVDNAQEIKKLMVERLKSYRDSGLGDSFGHSSPVDKAAPGETAAKRRLLAEIRDEAAAFGRAAEKLAAARNEA